jgi:hypothetical protein
MSAVAELGDKLAGLTIAQAVELKNYLKEKFGIEPAGGGVIAGPATAAPVAPTEKPAEPTEFNVVLDGCDAAKKKLRPLRRRRRGSAADRRANPKVLRPLPATGHRPDERDPVRLEGVLREIFPIESYDKTLALEYIKYELGKPRYDPDECRQLRLTYGRPFRVWLRLTREQPIEEEVYLGDMPIMIGGGEFIINGAERVVVSQLHRSPGVDFVVEIEAATAAASLPHHPRTRQLDRAQRHQEGHARRPHRPVGKFSAMTLLRAMDPAILAECRHPPRLLRNHETKGRRRPQRGDKIEGMIAVDDVYRPRNRRGLSSTAARSSPRTWPTRSAPRADHSSK